MAQAISVAHDNCAVHFGANSTPYSDVSCAFPTESEGDDDGEPRSYRQENVAAFCSFRREKNLGDRA